MVNSSSIFIWEGKVQLGDEPGIYGNASYSGLSMESPLTIFNMDENNPQDDLLKLEIITDGVEVFAGYPGHKIVVRSYIADPAPANPYQYKEIIIKDTDRIASSGTIKTIIDIPIVAQKGNSYISIAIEIDSTVKPGLYDDFVVTGLNYQTANGNIYTKFGFV